MSTDSLQGNNKTEDLGEGQVLETVATGVQGEQAGLVDPWRRMVAGAIAFLTALLLVFWGMHASQTTDPYVQSVLQISGDSTRGKDIFVLNCATCHGLEAAGEVGPDLNGVSERKSRVALIEQVISGQTPPMPQFQPSEKDMADLLSFLETL